MTLAIGAVVMLLGLICWIGQSLVFFAPEVAQKLGLVEPPEEMDETLYFIETKVQGLTDMLLTWMLPLSALLMILGVTSWPWLALIGGGIYLYFSSVIIFHRYFLKKQGKKVGRTSSVNTADVFGVLWIASAATMIGLAVDAMQVTLIMQCPRCERSASPRNACVGSFLDLSWCLNLLELRDYYGRRLRSTQTFRSNTRLQTRAMDCCSDKFRLRIS